jgi:DNA polymerase-3 subunit beta
MKFVVLAKNFLDSLSKVNRLTSSRTTLPILNSVLIKVEKGILKLSTTNLEIGITTQCGIKTEKEGELAVPCQLLTNLVNLLGKDEVLEVESSENDLILKTKNTQLKIKGSPAEDFPIIPKMEREFYFKIKGLDFKKGLSKVMFAISPSEARVEISGVLFSLNSLRENYLTLVGTDSYRLAEQILKLSEINLKEKKNLIVPLKTIQELVRLIEDEEEVEVYFSENQILFVYKTIELISRVISGEYPDYKQVIPQLFTTEIFLEKEPFLKAIKTVSLFSKSGINDINLKFNSKDNRIIVSSINPQLGEGEIILDGEIKGKDNEVIFNYRYLLEGILNMMGEEINIKIVDENNPVVLTCPQDKDYLYLIMPIRK